MIFNRFRTIFWVKRSSRYPATDKGKSATLLELCLRTSQVAILPLVRLIDLAPPFKELSPDVIWLRMRFLRLLLASKRKLDNNFPQPILEPGSWPLSIT